MRAEGSRMLTRRQTCWTTAFWLQCKSYLQGKTDHFTSTKRAQHEDVCCFSVLVFVVVSVYAFLLYARQYAQHLGVLCKVTSRCIHGKTSITHVYLRFLL